jgi:hypothetical protein
VGELGDWLVRARETRGLTLEDAERDTRISRRYLQALEDERFDIIPAPVYARGFLRSYSQYLGLDPQEAMARYPRDEEIYAGPAAQPRPARQVREQRPAVGAENRPTWRRPTPIRGGGSGVIPGPAPSQGHEPTIGIDIGVPVPTRRLDRDPAAPTRTAAVVVVALAAILFVVLLAFLVSSLGGDGNGGGINVPEDSANTAAGADDDDDALDPTATTATSAQPGIVPNVEGLTQEQAIAEVQAAGFVPSVRTTPNAATAGTVVSQSPAGDLEFEPGSSVILLVSSGPQ